jgi:ATP-dependent helicase/nuclease subunit B
LEAELTGAAFGTLIHESLRRWAESDALHATDPLQIRSSLEQAFDAQVAEIFAEEPLPAVKLQLEQAKLRLKTFAEWQALHRREGWEVKFFEVKAQTPLTLQSGRTLEIRGQIDRIDYNVASDKWLIIDYKTGDSGDGPDKVHLHSGEWVDLQLPLYRLLAASLDITGEPDVAYVTLGKDPPSEPKDLLKRATWSASQLAEAEAEIRRVAEHVAAGEFWSPSSEAPKFDDYACIVQEGVFGREAFE